MIMLNKIILMGRLTKDPELRHTQTGTPVAGFSLAVERNYSKKKERETDFFDVVAWQNRAEFVSKYFTKGQLVCVEGRLQRRSWVDKNNQTRYAYEVVAESVYFAGANKGEGQSGSDSGFDPFAEEVA
jgi:single-strand DNA-binding protein